MALQPANPLAEQVYLRVKDEIFDFHLLPGDRFTETDLADRLGVSRTPVRDALYRLKREGYLDVGFRSGWSVSPFDFVRFDELYDLRILLEEAAIIRRLDFLKDKRIDATYEEHAKILRLIFRRKSAEASILLRAHITQSKNEVRKITLHMLHEARITMTKLAAAKRAAKSTARSTGKAAAKKSTLR